MTRLLALIGLCGLIAAVGCSSDSSSGTGGSGGSGGTGGNLGDLEWPPDAAVYLDEHGIFHGDCATDEDCTMALGYFHARDRFVQMDIFRRLPTGRLSDIVNKPLVEATGLLEGLINAATSNRAVNSTRTGEPGEAFVVQQLDEKTRGLYEAYAAGVNQWLDDVRNDRNGATWPAEFGSPVLSYAPEDAPAWTPEDSIATVLTLVGGLTLDESAHIRAADARAAINNNNRFLDLWSLEPIQKSPVLEEGTYPPAPDASSTAKAETKRNPLFDRAAPALARLDAKLAITEDLRRIWVGVESIGADIGSNNWVLDGSKTESGNTFLSNDPHLGLSQPSVWYLAHLDAKTNGSGSIHTAGLSFPGLPYIVIGQNEDIAWGATNTGMDMTDVYIETLAKDVDGEPIGVMHKGEVVEFIRKDFTLNFNDGSTEVREMLFVPHHGAVREIDADNGVAITVRWTGNDMTTDANFLTGMATATTVLEGRDALENVTSIGQNWVVIDNQGNFGWFPYNRLPKRTWAVNLDMDDPNEPFPWLPLDGACETPDTCYEWDDYFEYAELPQAYNRANGYIATANSDLTGANFDGNPTNNGHAPIQSGVAAGYRTARIVELIDATNEHTRGTMEALISDVHSKIGRDMIPKILEIADDDLTTVTADAKLIVDALRGWGLTCPTGLDGTDPRMSPLADMAEVEESSGCTAWHEALREIDDALARDESTSSYPSFVTYFSIIDISRLKAGDTYWDDVTTDGPPETKYDIIGAALDMAGKSLLAEYATQPGSDLGVWPWGRKHGFVLKSELASLSSLFNEFNNPPGDGSEDFFANDGGLFTVDVANPNREGLHSSGPSTRFQCEGLAPVQCTIQLPGGQSGHDSSDNYDDLLKLWLGNDPLDLEFDINAAKENAASTFDYRE
jgi:penicillin amidase